MLNRVAQEIAERLLIFLLAHEQKIKETITVMNFLNTYNTSGTQDLTSNSEDKDELMCVSVPVDSESKGLISVTTYSAH